MDEAHRTTSSDFCSDASAFECERGDGRYRSLYYFSHCLYKFLVKLQQFPTALHVGTSVYCAVLEAAFGLSAYAKRSTRFRFKSAVRDSACLDNLDN